VNQPHYALSFTPAAARSIRKLPRDTIVRIKNATETLRINLRPHGAKALTGEHSRLWWIRVGDYRVAYEVRDAELLMLVVRVAHRRSLPQPLIRYVQLPMGITS
jgi:mRNA interferase RelE/StbE